MNILNIHFCPQLKDNIARIQSDTKASVGCDGGMKERNTEERWEEVLGCEEEQSGSLLGQIRENSLWESGGEEHSHIRLTGL